MTVYLFLFIPLMEGLPFFCPPHGGGAGGGYHLRRFAPPPPAEDTLDLDPCPLHHVPLMEGVQGEGTTSGVSRHLRQRRTPWTLILAPCIMSPSWRGCRGRIRIARGAIPTTTTSGASRHLRQRRTPWTLILAPCTMSPSWRGCRGRVPPPAFHATSASGGHLGPWSLPLSSYFPPFKVTKKLALPRRTSISRLSSFPRALSAAW